MALSRKKKTPSRAAGAFGTAAASASSSSPSVVTTSFLLGNLHCPTCVSTIKDVLRESCAGQVRWVSPNVVTSVVTVEHEPAASIAQMQRALEESGFEVSGVTTTSAAAELPDLSDSLRLQENRQPASRVIPTAAAHDNSNNHNDDSDHVGSLAALTKWISPSRFSKRAPAAHALTEAHLSHCAQCRAANEQSSHPGDADGPAVDETTALFAAVEPSSSSHAPRNFNTFANRSGSGAGSRNPSPKSKMSSKSLITLESDEDHVSLTVPLFRATLAVGGMTCAACVNTITAELNKKDWVASVAVNLLNNSATIDIYDKDRVDDLVASIEDLGYEAALDSLVNVNRGDGRPKRSDSWKASVAIGGMTCASCANGITKEMKKKDWVKDITVNLLTNSAVVVFDGKANGDKIVDSIEDLGYEVTINDLVNLGEEEEEESHRRTVEITIDGFYCEHCPPRILKSLAGFRRDIEVVSQPTEQKPRIKISYTPEAPNFTIRHILAAIDAIEPELKASIYHPPTLEERSKLIQRHHQLQILYRTIGTSIVVIPTFVIGIVYMSLVNDDDPSKKFLMEPWISGINRAQFALFILATPVYFFAASLFHTRAMKEIWALWRKGSRAPLLQRFYRFGSMNTLMSLGTTIAYFSSIAQLVVAAKTYVPAKDATPGSPAVPAQRVGDENFYFDSVVFLTFFLLLGRLIESYSKSRTGDAVEMLVKMRPTTALLVEGHISDKQADRVVQADLLELGDVVRVPNGASPPADGVIVQGDSSFDESSLTGESRPVRKSPGDDVFAGTVNKEAPVLVRIVGAAGESMLDQIVKLVREGQTKRAPMEQIADSLTTYFVPFITLIAILTWLLWMVLGYAGVVPEDWKDGVSGGWAYFGLQFAIAVFVVACPCGLALAAPTAIFVGGGIAAQHGILAKGGGEAFETASKVDCVVFDKTGTLTVGGEPTVTDCEIYGVAGEAEVTEKYKKQVLHALRAVEENSSHPIAKAIVSFCNARYGEKSKLEAVDLQEIPGRGMKAKIHGPTPEESFDLVVGNQLLMSELGCPTSFSLNKTLEEWQRDAKSTALVAILRHAPEQPDTPKYHIAAVLAISDPIRPEAPAVVRALENSGVQVWMLSGDNAFTARAVAAQVGIPPHQVIAEVLPAEKANKIQQLQTMALRNGQQDPDQAQQPQPQQQTQRAKWMPKSRRNNKSRRTHKNRAIVAMVGDGINDSPALTRADIGVAIGSGSDVAISSAAFVLVRNDLRALATLLRLSRAVFRRVVANFVWALVYNVVAVPVAAGVLYPVVSGGKHVRLDPVWASLAMALSSISVVLSSLALRVRVPEVGFRDRVVLVEGEEESL